MVISKAAIRRPVTVVMAFIAVAMIGAFSAFRLPIEQFPEMEIPYVGVSIPYNGTSAQEIERNVTRPVEEILSTMTGVERMFSFTRPGQVFFNLSLHSDSDVNGKGIEAKDLVEGIRHRLPDDVRRIQLRQQDPNDEPLMNMLIVAPNLKQDEAWDLLDVNVRSELERIQGVNSVNLYGIVQNQVRVVMQSDRVASYGLDYIDIRRRLQQSNFYVSAGKVEGISSPREMLVRPIGQYESVDAIGQLPLNDRGLVLADVAEIRLEPDQDNDRRLVNGERSLGVSVFKKPEENLVEVSQRIDEVMTRIQDDDVLEGATFFPLDSQADTVLKSLNDLRDSGLLGGLLSVIVLFLYLRQVNMSLLIAATVPLSLCATLGVMYFMGLTLNILSVVGLMLAIGLLVDNSVVASEAIAFRRREDGVSPREAADRGISDVGLAITAGTLTTVIVFVPAFMTDVQQVAIVQQNIAIPLCTSLIASLLVAQTLVPAVMARMPVPKEVRRQPIIDFIGSYYSVAVRFTLRHRLLSLLAAIGIGYSGYWAYQQVPLDMNPEQESPRATLSYYIRGSMNIEYMEEFVRQVDGYLLDNKERFEIENVFTSYDTDRGRTTINFIEDGTLSPRVIEQMIMEDLPERPNIFLRFSTRSRGFGGMSSGRGRWGGSGLSMRLMGDSTEQLIEIGDELVALLENNESLTNIQHDGESSRSELQLVLKPEQAGQLGVTAAMISQTLAIALGETSMRRGYVENGRETEIYLELDGRDEINLDAVRNLPVFLPDGGTLPVEAVATLKFDSATRVVRRENRETSINLSFATAEGPPQAASEIVEQTMANYQLPPGYSWELGGGFSLDNEIFVEMALSGLLAILLIYMLMAALFESVLFPTTVIVAIGFSVVGALWSLLLTGTTITMMALIGMLLLAGIVVNNAIVLLNRIIQLRNEGQDRESAIVNSGIHRMRPILMTVCTTFFAMLPLAVGDVSVGGNGPAYFPMARALIGGLAFSSVITLLILPLIYVLFDDLRESTSGFWRTTWRRAFPVSS